MLGPVKAKPEILAPLSSDPGELATETGRASLTAAIASKDAQQIAEASKRIQTHGLSGWSETLVTAFRDLCGSKRSADPACIAREAVLTALDTLDYGEAAIFADAAQWVEPVRGKALARDTAGRVRVRGVLGLARLGHPDVMPIFGARLADVDANVRFATATAIGHRGQREGAGLLLLKLGVGDADANVVRECLRALVALAPDLAVPTAQRLLRSSDTATRELTLHALGATPDDRALAVLEDELARCTTSDERASVIEALGLSVRPRARAALITLIETGTPGDAEAALRALSIHRYDTKLVEQIRDAVDQHGSTSLQALFARTMG